MIDGFAGVMTMETSAGGVIVSVVLPVTVPEFAEIVVLPTAAPVASPAAVTLATVEDEELHVTDAVRFWVDPSLYVPVAVYCSFVPDAVDWFAGVTVMDNSAAGFTVSVVKPVTAPNVAVIVLPPTPTPVARPPIEIVAIAGADEFQLTDDVRFCVVPSL